jgi:hypothetical protein
MITQRQLDIWHIEAQEYAQSIREEFERALQGTREEDAVDVTAMEGENGRQPS